jgi:hypothetical protein
MVEIVSFLPPSDLHWDCQTGTRDLEGAPLGLLDSSTGTGRAPTGIV